MKKVCPHCGQSVGSVWHKQFGVQKLNRAAGEIGVPVVGRVTLRKEALAVVYICELTNLPFLVVVEKARQNLASVD